jgi:hypothetical protein
MGRVDRDYKAYASEYSSSASLYRPALKCSLPNSFSAIDAAICSSVGLHCEDLRRSLSFHDERWDRMKVGE